MSNRLMQGRTAQTVSLQDRANLERETRWSKTGVRGSSHIPEGTFLRQYPDFHLT